MTLDHLSSALPPSQREGRREREIHWATQFLTDSDRVARPPPHYHAWPCAQLCFGAAVLGRKQARVHTFAQCSLTMKEFLMVADVPWNSDTLFKIIPYHLWTAKLPCVCVCACVGGRRGVAWVGVQWVGVWGMGAFVRGGVCSQELCAGTRDNLDTWLISRAAVMISRAFSHSLFLSSFEAALDSLLV